VAHAISTISLPRERKVALFATAARRPNVSHRRAALEHLAPLDPPRLAELLTRAIDELPQTPAGPYNHCPEKSYSELIVRTDDARPWQALERALRRADIGLRMELLESVAFHLNGQHRRGITLLKTFLDDTAVRDIKSNPKKYEGFYAGWGFKNLSVRNLVAILLADLWKLPDDPASDWSESQWAALREKLRKTPEP
jgi:hypothetical protein